VANLPHALFADGALGEGDGELLVIVDCPVPIIGELEVEIRRITGAVMYVLVGVVLEVVLLALFAVGAVSVEAVLAVLRITNRGRLCELVFTVVTGVAVAAGVALAAVITKAVELVATAFAFAAQAACVTTVVTVATKGSEAFVAATARLALAACVAVRAVIAYLLSDQSRCVAALAQLEAAGVDAEQSIVLDVVVGIATRALETFYIPPLCDFGFSFGAIK